MKIELDLIKSLTDGRPSFGAELPVKGYSRKGEASVSVDSTDNGAVHHPLVLDLREYRL